MPIQYTADCLHFICKAVGKLSGLTPPKRLTENWLCDFDRFLNDGVEDSEPEVDIRGLENCPDVIVG